MTTLFPYFWNEEGTGGTEYVKQYICKFDTRVLDNTQRLETSIEPKQNLVANINVKSQISAKITKEVNLSASIKEVEELSEKISPKDDISCNK